MVKKQLEPDAFYSSIEEILPAFGSSYGGAQPTTKLYQMAFFGLH
jgi:hypothetical protein